jgi:hypothetical protein
MPFMPVPSRDRPSASHGDVVFAANTKITWSPPATSVEADALPGSQDVRK